MNRMFVAILLIVCLGSVISVQARVSANKSVPKPMPTMESDDDPINPNDSPSITLDQAAARRLENALDYFRTQEQQFHTSDCREDCPWLHLNEAHSANIDFMMHRGDPSAPVVVQVEVTDNESKHDYMFAFGYFAPQRILAGFVRQLDDPKSKVREMTPAELKKCTPEFLDFLESFIPEYAPKGKPPSNHA